MNITDEELRIIALKVVSNNQELFGVHDDESQKIYFLAYNDGVLDLLNAILKEKEKAL